MSLPTFYVWGEWAAPNQRMSDATSDCFKDIPICPRRAWRDLVSVLHADVNHNLKVSLNASQGLRVTGNTK